MLAGSANRIGLTQHMRIARPLRIAGVGRSLGLRRKSWGAVRIIAQTEPEPLAIAWLDRARYNRGNLENPHADQRVVDQ